MNNLKYTKGATELLDLAYCYTPVSSGVCSGAGGNNGQITTITDNVESGRSAHYTYDALGRLSTAETDGSIDDPRWDLSYEYDRYGNLEKKTVVAWDGLAGDGPTGIDPSYTATTNQISDTGFDYDASGNMTDDPIGITLTYDAENRMTTRRGTLGEEDHFYDGSVLRIKRVADPGGTPVTTVYIYSGTKVIAEYVGGTLDKEYIYLGSTLLATIDNPGSSEVVTYHHNDHLSARINTDSTGAKVGEQGHYPFGEDWDSSSTANKWGFTNYERESAAELNYATFRFDSSRLGRFMTPDPLAGSIANPQSLNRYGYVVNDPINLIDPLGLDHDCTYVWVEIVTSEGGITTVFGYWQFISCGGGGGGGGGNGGGGGGGTDEDNPNTTENKTELPATDQCLIVAEQNRLAHILDRFGTAEVTGTNLAFRTLLGAGLGAARTLPAARAALSTAQGLGRIAIGTAYGAILFNAFSLGFDTLAIHAIESGFERDVNQCFGVSQ